MSLDATRWAWKQKVSPSEKLILLSLADRADESHVCFPSISRIESDTGLHRQTIMSSILEMEKLGILTVSRVHGRGNKYQLVGVDGRENQYEKPYQSEKPYQYEKPDHPSTKTRTTTSTKNRTQNLPTESTNESVNIFSDIDSQILADYLKLRKAKKAGEFTDTSLNAIRKQADIAGLTISQALEVCCLRNWVGFDASWLKQKQPSNVQDARLEVADFIFGRNRNGTHGQVIDVVGTREIAGDPETVRQIGNGIR